MEPPDFVKKQIQLFLSDNNYSNSILKFSNASKDGDNFLGSLYRVNINAKKNNENKELNLVVKCFPIDEKMRVFSKIDDMFLNEIAFYEERLPLFVNLLKDFNMTFNDVPFYYKGCKTPKNEILILEDLRTEGFVLKETKLLDYPHAVLVAQHLGRFHAYSFALRDKKPKEFENFRKIKEPLFFKTNCYEKQIDALMEVALKALENEDKHYIEKIQQLRKNAQKMIDYSCDSKNSEPYSTLNHGDLWTLNILFKYNEKLEPEDIRFLDFQLQRFASPAIDILYTFFTCLNQEVKEKYFDELLYHYHNSLSQLLKTLSCDVEKIYPFEALLEHLQRFGSFGACMCLIDLHLITAQMGDNPQPLYNLDYLKTLPELLKTNKLYYTTMRDSLKLMVDRNYL
ncbi:uncharacterized protein LOC127286789 [Leptopilina boulardi]|uniref:uncharacterized protein LOC127286789 n=1 Tax=Leptopilina boulardi TaxID=63433 RepID=UPI0021F57795|nr:uncharacterized protein LOC127286789 [Leptopilina boulardi]